MVHSTYENNIFYVITHFGLFSKEKALVNLIQLHLVPVGFSLTAMLKATIVIFILMNNINFDNCFLILKTAVINLIYFITIFNLFIVT